MELAGGTRAVRGIDPDLALRLASTLADTRDRSEHLELAIRRALSRGGTTSVAAGRVGAVGRWAVQWSEDIHRRIGVIAERRQRTVAHLLPLLGSLRDPGFQCDPGAATVATWFADLHPDDQAWLGATYATRLGSLDGAPAAVRYAANRQLIRDHLPDAEAAVERAREVLRATVAVRPLTPHEAVALLVARRRAAADLADAESVVANLRTWSRPDRRILLFDPTDGGRVAEVIGDLETAAHVAYVLPGVSNTFATYEAQHRPNVDALAGAAGDDVALVSFLYDAPDTLTSGAFHRHAERGGADLAELVEGVSALTRPDAHATVVAHSYGTVTTSHALRTTTLASRIDDVVLLGSPGVDVDRRSDLPADVRIWAAAAPWDPVPWLPPHDGNPATPGFGAQRFHVGDARGHSAYYTAEESLANIARIVTGDLDAVTGPAHEPSPEPSGRRY